MPCFVLHHTEVLSHMLAPNDGKRPSEPVSGRVEPGTLRPNSVSDARDTQMPSKSLWLVKETEP